MYDEKEYWDNRINPNSASDLITELHINFVKSCLGDAKFIMDFGPGVGRTFPAYEKIETVIGWDITEQYAVAVIKESEKYNFDFQFTTNPWRKMGETPYIRNFFDAVVSVSVFLHQRPHNILKVMRELARIGKKVIVASYFNPNEPLDVPCEEEKEYEKHCFNYNYFDICKENGWKMSDKHWEEDMYLMFTYSEADQVSTD
jgi:SAM-dependent methyltransferase